MQVFRTISIRPTAIIIMPYSKTSHNKIMQSPIN